MNDKTKILIAVGILLLVYVFALGIIILIQYKASIIVKNADDDYLNTQINEDIQKDENIMNNKSEVDGFMKTTTNINVIIDGKKYSAKIEDNETAKSFISKLPQEFNMNELNGNEKYVYMDNLLPTNASKPKYIEVGDIMLYGNDCLVIFYKSFDTNYSYTKIGHINNLHDLGSNSIIAKFE